MKTKGELTTRILEALDEVPHVIGDLFEIFSLPYGTSLSSMQYHLDRHRRERSKNDAEERVRHRFNVLVHRLKKEGFIVQKHTSKGIELRLSNAGKNILARLREKKLIRLPARTYERYPSTELKIITFDIPEKERRKRDWLRTVLTRLGFTILQRSVWTGTAEIPEDFLRDLREMKLLSCVEIFSVGKKGTLEKVE